MKFAKELEQSAVPEWRVKYLNYKGGKKLIKSISRAIARANQTPASNARSSTHPMPRWSSNFNFSPSQNRPPVDAFSNGYGDTEPLSPRLPPEEAQEPQDQREGSPKRSPSQDINRRKVPEQAASEQERDLGSFVPTPPEFGSQKSQPPGGDSIRRHPTFELPEPALSDDEVDDDPLAIRIPRPVNKIPSRGILKRSSQKSELNCKLETVMTPPPPPPPNPQRVLSSITIPNSPRNGSSAYTMVFTPITPRQNALRRLFSTTSLGSPGRPMPTQAEHLNVAQERERLFFKFLDDELQKVEGFYAQKEEQAGKRLDLLRAQLHEMRNRRLQEMAEQRKRRNTLLNANFDASPSSAPTARSNNTAFTWNRSIKGIVPQFKPGPNSRALLNMPNTPHLGASAREAVKDYIRKPTDHEVPYRTAKQKLKLALQEFYRGLELLKAYALLNRTAFRKLNKKYDKTVNAKPPLKYVNEKVNRAWFVRSDVLDGHLKTVEDLYARYFEKGNHKVAVGKLRSLGKKEGDFSDSAFRNGLLIGLGLVFAVEGIVFGVDLLHGDDPAIATQAGYLLQLYAGFFLMLLLFTLFCIDCWVWTKNKVNYQFIFELDPRHQLDWRQLAEFPCFMWLLFGFFMWLNFSQYGAPEMFLYYPVILIGVAVIVIFLPVPILQPNARKWLVYSHWRLFLAGLYPVEFRDFFLGDMYCSLTYATSNIALFFCLYDTEWKHPPSCNSSHSRIMGFLAALPPIWRFLQCIRRFYDTRNWFPHLVNCGKYTMSIMAAVTLSLYRIHTSNGLFALFVVFTTINSLYTAVWDLFMDFSVLQPGARKYLLRDVLALKKKWIYYTIMIIDPPLRFSWIFYAIFRNRTQHSAVVSFFVSLAEVLRRGVWTLLRVENEHCSNVSQYKASRDVPLPYHITLRSEDEIAASPLVGHPLGDTPRLSPAPTIIPDQPPAPSTGVATGPSPRPSPAVVPEQDITVDTPGIRKRRSTTGMTFSKMLAEAHRQDFEKKRKTEKEVEEEERGKGEYDDEDDDDDDLDRSDDGSENEIDVEQALEAEMGKGKGR